MPRKGKETRLVADAMLGSLTRKLRAFGFDTLYFREGSDQLLMSIAKSTRRIILTSDVSLAESASRRDVITLTVVGRTEGERLASMRKGAEAVNLLLLPGVSRCPICNGHLGSLSRLNAIDRVPESVGRRHRKFFECEDCGRLYWHGSHWKKLRSLRRRLL